MCIYQVETVTDSETESKGLPQFHSIGIQVEDQKRYVAQINQVLLCSQGSIFTFYHCPWQAWAVQALKQCDHCSASRHGVRGLSLHGGQGPAVRWCLRSPL